MSKSKKSDNPYPANTISAILYVSKDEFSILYGLLADTPLAEGNPEMLIDVLAKKDGNYTLFAPTDSAFKKLRKEKKLDGLTKDEIRRTLLYHVLAGRVYSEAMNDGATPTTVGGKNLCIWKTGKKLCINGKAHIVLADSKATNGVIHAIDHVLLPVDECKRDVK